MVASGDSSLPSPRGAPTPRQLLAGPFLVYTDSGAICSALLPCWLCRFSFQLLFPHALGSSPAWHCPCPQMFFLGFPNKQAGGTQDLLQAASQSPAKNPWTPAPCLDTTGPTLAGMEQVLG